MDQTHPVTQKIPVTILTGFLGSGKTTLLNHILTDKNHGMKFAIIENEFGEVNIDSDLVSIKENVAEELISMDNGCMCCTVRDDLVKGIRQMLATGKNFDAILIETTGMADPGPVVQTFFQNEDIARRCEVDGVITMIDCKHVKQHLFAKVEGDADTVNESMQQVCFADRILFNKTDLITEEDLVDLKDEIKDLNKLAEVYECQYGKVDPMKLLNMKKFSLDKVLDFDPDFLKPEPEHSHSHGHGHESKKDEGHSHGHGHGHGHEKKGEDCDKEGCTDESHSHDHAHSAKKRKTRHDTSVSSVGITLTDDEELNLPHLQQWIGELMQTKGEDLYRYKGIISVKGFDQKFVFQGVHMLFDGDFMGEWKEGEKRVSKFVFIGKKLDRKMLEDGFRKCIAGKLRFKVGDKVFARVKGGFKPGVIIKEWDNGHPYRIQIEDESGTNVYGPMDDDRVIKVRTGDEPME